MDAKDKLYFGTIIHFTFCPTQKAISSLFSMQLTDRDAWLRDWCTWTQSNLTMTASWIWISRRLLRSILLCFSYAGLLYFVVLFFQFRKQIFFAGNLLISFSGMAGSPGPLRRNSSFHPCEFQKVSPKVFSHHCAAEMRWPSVNLGWFTNPSAGISVICISSDRERVLFA